MEAIKINDLRYQKLGESEVIKRILAGEKELYEILVRRNNQKLYRVIRSYLKDGAEIEDTMQNTYLKAYTNLHQFRLDASFSTWLIRIGINDALARVKEKGKQYAINQDSFFMEQNTILQMPDKNELNPQDKMIKNESKQLLENAIDELEIKYRTVYILKEVEEMTHDEIATALDLTVANVKVRLHRAKEMLKEKLYELSIDKNIFEFGFSKCDRVTENVMRLI
jgi:RNA polymerase sigma factor (sigma-70 family)